MTHEEAVVMKVLEYWCNKDAAEMVGLFSEEGVYDNVPDASPMHGKAAIRNWLNAVFQHCHVEADVLHIATQDNWVLSERVDTHVLGSKRIPLPVMNAAQIIDGKVAVWRDYYCRQMVKEIGLTVEHEA